MIRHPSLRSLLAGVCALLVGTCGEAPDDEGVQMEPQQEAEAPAPTERRVVIARPRDGDTVEGPQVSVELEAHGFRVVEAGDTTPNSGHHHLFLDRDVSPPDEPIPAEEGHIVHMGDGSTTYTFENVEPGSHRLITVVGDAIHVPVSPPLQDTVEFTVP